MLTGIITQITGFFSKPFLFGAMLPMLLAIVVNGGILGWVYEPFQTWLGAFWSRSTTENLQLFLTALLPAFVFAYVLWTTNPFLLSVLEGHVPFYWLDALLVPFKTPLIRKQQRRFTDLQNQIDSWRKSQRGLTKAAAAWPDLLIARRAIGATLQVNTYEANEQLNQLMIKRGNGRALTIDDLQPRYNELSAALAANNANLASPEGDWPLDRDHDMFVRLIQTAAERANAEYLRAFSQRERDFSVFQIEPTTMGNIAESVRGYALSRYSLDLSIFWSRLVAVIKNDDDKFFDLLVDQKAQLDFVLALFWLSVLSTVGWFLALPLVSLSVMPIVAVGCLGPIISVGIYNMAVLNHQTFADLQRAAIDLNRLKLLDALQIPAPATTTDEKNLWSALTKNLAYRDSVTLRFKAPADPKK